jgi:hypothetical protein
MSISNPTKSNQYLSSKKRSEATRICKTQKQLLIAVKKKRAIADSWVDHSEKGGGASNPAKDP